MVKPRWGDVLRRVHSLLDQGIVPALSDRELLERYATSGPEAAEPAFAALVDRHGPMVLRVCRHVLRDEHAAEDAFQATFLVLARMAAALWVHDSMAPWLQGHCDSRPFKPPPRPEGNPVTSWKTRVARGRIDGDELHDVREGCKP
jgi:hypothetical protein